MIITKNDILSEEDRLLIVKDIQYELKHHPTPNKLKPLYQSKVDIHRKYVKIHKHWDNFFLQHQLYFVYHIILGQY